MSLFLKYCLLLFVMNEAVANSLRFTSNEAQTTLIELYTSEGCSSCPPADEFLNQFTNSDELWNQYIPMAFHVDYWDYIGWQDSFATASHSNRQRKHQQQGNISSVYTPGFVVNGEEWTGFFKAWRTLPEFNQFPGQLEIIINRHSATISYPKAQQKYQYNLVILGMGLTTEVTNGENSGRKLQHDFVVLNHQTQSGQSSTTLNLPLIMDHNPKQFAVVAWITTPESMQPIQAVGGLLPSGSIKSI